MEQIVRWQIATRNFVSFLKHRLQRGYSYVGVLGIGLVVAESLQNILVNAGWPIPIYVLYPLGISFLMLVGVIDSHFGFFTKEMQISTSQNHYLISHLDRISSEVRKLREEINERKS